MPVGKPHKPANAKSDGFKMSKGTQQCAIGVLVIAVIVGLSHVFSPSEEAPQVAVPAGTAAGGAVKTLDDGTFQEFVNSHPDGVLVDFYSQSCKFCTKLAPEFDAAAKELKSSGGPPLASIDSEAGALTVQKYAITRYPTVHWFWKGENVLELPRASEKTAAEIAEWVRGKQGPAVQELDTRAEFEEALGTLRQTLHAKARLIVGSDRADTEGERDALEAAAQRHRMTTVFLFIKEVTSEHPVVKSYGQDASNDEAYEGATNPEEVTAWVRGILEKAKPPKDDGTKAATDAKTAADKAIEQVQKALENDAEATAEAGEAGS